ncbi:MAG: formyltetrahydrofolate deformylase [Cellvibrionaceae bacterium]
MGKEKKLILKLSCVDRPGIVADVADFFRESGFNIQESSQFNDVETQQFFMRCVFEWCGSDNDFSIDHVTKQFSKVAEKSQMHWQLNDSCYRPKVLIAVSKWGHCLNSLLNSWKLGSLPIDIVGVVSNHEDMRPLVEWYNLPYHYFPVTGLDKVQQEKKIYNIFAETQSDLLVLARYMQILSDDFCENISGRAINIHHSFLPGFKGARPYHQAHARGVKLIGATAHYVTADLDEGPIIEQAVERVTHASTADQLVEIGRDIEAVVLQRAVRWHAEHRILINGHKTVVFNR